MCGRFDLHSDPTRVAREFGAQLIPPDQWGASWNVAPTDPILGVREHVAKGGADQEPTRTVETYRWGLLGPWIKDPKRAGSTFNARAESLTTNNTFRKPFRERRLIVPADHYYEWRKLPGARKQPYAISRADGQMLAFAGLWQPWKPPNGGDWILTATIITGPAGPDTEALHDRQPVVLEPDLWEAWLDERNDDFVELEAMLVPAQEGTLRSYPVSAKVGNVANNDSILIEEAPAEPSS